MKFEVRIHDLDQPEGKRNRVVASCSDLRDACIIGIAFLQQFQRGCFEVLACKSGQYFCGGALATRYTFDDKCELDPLVLACKQQLAQMVTSARKLRRRMKWHLGRWDIRASMVLNKDDVFIRAWCTDDFATAEQRAVELGYPPKQKEVA